MTAGAQRTAARFWRISLYATMAAVGVLWIAPILWMLSTSLKPESEIFRYPIHWIPEAPTLEYYAALFDRFPLAAWFRNSLIVATITTVTTVVVCTLAAYPLARMEFRGRRFLLVAIIATFLVPSELSVVPMFLGLTQVGMTDSYFSLSIPFVANAFGLFILVQFFRSIPRELEEAAIVDGCGPLGFFFRILLPLSGPAIATVAIFAFVASWNDFFWPLIVTNTDATRTLTVGLATLVAGAGMSMRQGVVMASAVMATLPALVLFLLLQRYFVRSVAATGIKG